MRIRYTVNYHKCPKCTNILKQENELLYMLIVIFLSVATAFTWLLWLLGEKIIKKFYQYQKIDRLGDKVKVCPVCKTKVCIESGIEWIQLRDEEMKAWAYRRIYHWSVFLSYFVLLGFFGQLFWFSSHQADKYVACILLLVLIVFTIIEVVFYIYWKTLHKKEYILVNKKDFDKIKKSLDSTLSKIEDQPFIIKIKETGQVYGSGRNIKNSENTNYISKMLVLSKTLYNSNMITREEYEKQINNIAKLETYKDNSKVLANIQKSLTETMKKVKNDL